MRPADPRDRLLDAALELGERVGWDKVHLHEVASAAGVELALLREHFAQKDDLAEAWFDRADDALLRSAQAPGWAARTVRERLHDALIAWLGALAPRRRLTREMLRYKLQPEHVHLQALGLTRVSRTVQWWREAAGLPSSGWRREAEEVALTTIYLATFARWLWDDSDGSHATRDWLARQLALAERAALALDGRR